MEIKAQPHELRPAGGAQKREPRRQTLKRITNAARNALGAVVLAAAGTAFLTTPIHAADAPSQVPLLQPISNAKPNLMIAFDNSASMALEFPDGYKVQCAVTSGLVTYVMTLLKTIGVVELLQVLGLGGIVDLLNYLLNCTSAQNLAMRSAHVNPLFYNPAITYSPRINGTRDVNGLPSEQEHNLIFVDNQNSGPFEYKLLNEVSAGISGGIFREVLVNQSDEGSTLSSIVIPVHVPKYEVFSEEPRWDSSDKEFLYVRCDSKDCEKNKVVKITWNRDGVLKLNKERKFRPAMVELPPNHMRSDCGPTSCTSKQEMENILNWYKWYRNRMLALTTSIGQAMWAHDGEFRVGYIKYNVARSRPGKLLRPITDLVSDLLNPLLNPLLGDLTNLGLGYLFSDRIEPNDTVDRGVRYFEDAWKAEFYDWLYGLYPFGDSQAHNAYNVVAKYYDAEKNLSKENPWRNDPGPEASESSGALSCRRSHTLLISDGAWSEDKNARGQNYPTKNWASQEGRVFEGRPNGTARKLRYKPSGADGVASGDFDVRLAARELYIPYSDGGKGQNGLADLAAEYFWHKDFSALDNNVPPVPSQNNPTFWQNVTTFTMGWGIRPTGERSDVRGGRLTYKQIEDYRNNWLSGGDLNGLGAQQPEWLDNRSAFDLTRESTFLLPLLYERKYEEYRVNDFIRAGYAGGGRAYSVFTAEDVRQAMDDILRKILAGGRETGVGISGDSGSFDDLSGKIKYTTRYDLSDNSGDVRAFTLTKDGGHDQLDDSGAPVPLWSANARMPDVKDRKLFVRSGDTQSRMGYNTKLSTLPKDLQKLLNDDGKQREDETFVRYLLGQDGLTDTTGAPYRSRSTPIGATLNSMPLFVGGQLDMGYADFGDVGGKSNYKDYTGKKRAIPPAIFAATNEGKVHVINGATSATELPGKQPGEQLGAFMPKGVMGKQTMLASPNYRFEYVLDGPLAEHDIYTSNGWRQLVTGSGGRGGKFLFGLNSPVNAKNDRIPSQGDFLWEVDAGTTGYGDMSYITNKAVAGQLDDGTWVVLSTSGHYPGGKEVGLYVINAQTGALVEFIKLPSKSRGLGGVTAVRDTNRRIVAAYAGDANGNLWRFDLRSSRMSVSYGKPLFTTPGGAKQPIYAAPAWQIHPGDGKNCSHSATRQCGTIVVVGTGILLDEDDLKPGQSQVLFGIWDKTPVGGDEVSGAAGIRKEDLVVQTIDQTSETTGVEENAGRKLYRISSKEVDWTATSGWMLELGVIKPDAMWGDLGDERIIGDLANLGNTVSAVSFFPQMTGADIEACTVEDGIPNIVYVVDALTGGNTRAFGNRNAASGDIEYFSIALLEEGGIAPSNVFSSNALGLSNETRPDNAPSDCTEQTGHWTGVGSSVSINLSCEEGDKRNWRQGSWHQIVNPPF